LIKSIKAKLLRFFTSKKQNNFEIKNSKKVLFLRYDRIGDMIISTPVFRELKNAYPQIQITVLASAVNKDILKNNPYVDAVYINHKNSFFSDFKTLLKLRKEKFDTAIEFDHSVIPHAILRLKIINPKKIISIFKEGRYGLKGTELQMYDVYTHAPKNLHFRDIWLLTLSPFGITPSSSHYDLFFTQEQNDAAKKFLSQFPKGIKIGINLEGAVKGKKIQDNELFDICQNLYINNKNIQIIILTTPKKYPQINTLIKDMNLDFVHISYKTESILDVAALISNLDLIITPDTSIVHVASTFDKPVVTIHENNQDSFRLFAPTSTLAATVFSKNSNSLEGYSLQELIKKIVPILDQIQNKGSCIEQNDKL